MWPWPWPGSWPAWGEAVAGPIRCFVGLPLPQAYKDALAGLLPRLRSRISVRVSWTTPDTWHLTLRFLGETLPERVEAATAALAGVRFAAFDLEAGGGGFFPDARRPRVVWAGLSRGGPECAALARAVDQALAPLDFEPERRPFSPHLTLGRVKEGGRPEDWTRLLGELAKLAWPVARMERLVFWQSVLGPRGAAHTPLAEYPAAS